MKVIHNQIHLATNETYTLTEGDVGCELPENFGAVQPIDVGKRVVQRRYGLCMENNEQRDERLRRLAKSPILGAPYKAEQHAKNQQARNLMDKVGTVARVAKPTPPANQICEACGAEIYLKSRHIRSHDGIGICITSGDGRHNPNPLFYRNGQWFFYDETWSNEHGPYPTHAQASAALAAYCHYLDTGDESEFKKFAPTPEVNLSDLLTDAQLEALAHTIGELTLQKVDPMDPRFAERLKELFTPWGEELEAKGVLPDFLAYAVVNLLSGGKRR